MMQIFGSWALEGSEENKEPPKSKAPDCNMHFVMENATGIIYVNNTNYHHNLGWVWWPVSNLCADLQALEARGGHAT